MSERPIQCLSYDGQKSKKQCAVYDSDTPVTLTLITSLVSEKIPTLKFLQTLRLTDQKMSILPLEVEQTPVAQFKLSMIS